MTPERWRQVKEIFQKALDRAPGERSAFVASACGRDESLRHEVESLLASYEKDGTFIDSPAYERAAEAMVEKSELKAGQTIGSYEIVSFISRGGMGEVYLAQDRRLSRKVALKLLPASFIKDDERLRRFEQEARAASALNHPNIITIYEILEANSTLIIATEFVEGETLRHRLSYDRLALQHALHIAIQIADALAAAHKAGIIHRDIKPENIMIRPDGYAKVLDFGLAKLAEQTSSEVAAEAPTKHVRTGSGMILGTAGYMSPEQARGKTVDARSDIFSLGAVIYEMVTQRKPFDGETPSDLLAAILKTEPPALTQFAPEAPPELVRIVTKTLRKDREERYQVVKDLLLDLKSLKEELDFQTKLDRSVAPSQSVEEQKAPSQVTTIERPFSDTSEIKTAISTLTHSLSIEIKRHRISIALAALGLAVLMTIGVITLYKSLNRSGPINNETRQVLRTSQITFSPGLDGFPSLSPDGKSVAYSSDQSGSFEIYIKQLTPGGGELQLTNDGKQNMHPSWSPDGQRLAYHSKSGGGIWFVSALGGPPKQLTEFGARPAWSPDGSTIAFQSGLPAEIFNSRAMAPSTIWLVPSQGGTPRQVTHQGNPPGGHTSASWSPDGKRIAFEVSDFIFSSCWSVAVEDGELKRIAPGNNPIYAPDGRHIYFGGESRYGAGLFQIELSSAGDPIGEPTRLMGPGAGEAIRNLAISVDGKRIVYSANRTSSNLWTVPLSPGSGEATGSPSTFSRDTSLRNNLARFSPDGRKLALNRWRPGTSADIWVANADGSNLTQVTNNPATDTQASWFPEGDKLAFLSDRDNTHLMLWTISLATGKEERFLDLGEGVQFAQMSPDAKEVAFNLIQNGVMNIWIATIHDGHRKQLTFDDQLMGFPCWSPDSQLIAFEQQRGEDAYLMVIPSNGGQPTQLTFDHAKSWPHSWSPDGDKIAFAGQRDGVWNIYWVSRSTRVQKQLTNYSKLNSFVRYPTWSPSGNQIVYEYAETTGNIWLTELK